MKSKAGKRNSLIRDRKKGRTVSEDKERIWKQGKKEVREGKEVERAAIM